MATTRILERDVQKQCLAWLGLKRVFCWRANSGAVTYPATATTVRRFVRTASVAGVSDIIGVLPGGSMLAVECKRKGQKPTPSQAVFLAQVRAAGGVGIVVDSLDSLVEQLTPHLEGP